MPIGNIFEHFVRIKIVVSGQHALGRFVAYCSALTAAIALITAIIGLFSFSDVAAYLRIEQGQNTPPRELVVAATSRLLPPSDKYLFLICGAPSPSVAGLSAQPTAAIGRSKCTGFSLPASLPPGAVLPARGMVGADFVPGVLQTFDATNFFARVRLGIKIFGWLLALGLLLLLSGIAEEYDMVLSVGDGTGWQLFLLHLLVWMNAFVTGNNAIWMVPLIFLWAMLATYFTITLIAPGLWLLERTAPALSEWRAVRFLVGAITAPLLLLLLFATYLILMVLFSYAMNLVVWMVAPPGLQSLWEAGMMRR